MNKKNVSAPGIAGLVLLLSGMQAGYAAGVSLPSDLVAAQAAADAAQSGVAGNAAAINDQEARISWLENFVLSVIGSKTVFVTEDTYSGDLLAEAQAAFSDCSSVSTGLDGADCICQKTAQAAGIWGVYKAWIATDSFNDPESMFTPSGVPYTRVDGTAIAYDWGDLTNGGIYVALNLTETGSVAGAPLAVWTNVATSGTSSGTTDHCSGWSSSASGQYGGTGRWNAGDLSWTEPNILVDCSTSAHLYCFQQ